MKLHQLKIIFPIIIVLLSFIQLSSTISVSILLK